ncbi:molybdenum cofactor biosynthesis protein MoaA, partial [Klebsiella pneumoniae]|nr:molybdenum cofactor biosynthesis protein MoaA [Klebsiella pneumoniae]
MANAGTCMRVPSANTAKRWYLV